MTPSFFSLLFRGGPGLWLLAGWLAGSASAWDYEGHRLINQLALATLPPEFPEFVRAPANRERVAFLAGEPDRWRNTPDLPLKHANGPDHYFDLDLLPPYRLDPADLTPFRYDFMAQTARARAARPDDFPALDASKDADHTRALIGFLPWTITEYEAKLKSAFSCLKEYQAAGTPEEILNARGNVLYLMGVLGHFVGDGAQPLHTTRHHHGWVGENPEGFSTNYTLHAWIDGGYLEQHGADPAKLQARLRPARSFPAPAQRAAPAHLFPEVLRYLQAQHRQVLPLYQLEKAGKLSGRNRFSQEGHDFITGQLVQAAQMLGDLWLTAWEQAPADLFLRSTLARRTAAAAGPPAPYDTVLRHGRVVDGAGNPAVFADVAIRDGRIAAVGRIAEAGRREIEARGCVIAPGFIDVHTHAEDVEVRPQAENFLRMGVTTVVVGNCGSSTLDVAGFFRRLAATNLSLNVATLVGHGSIRNQVMGGSFMRPPTGEELAAMRGLAARAMAEGAVGLSTGLIYLPGTFAKTEELIEVTKAIAPYGGIYASHMRSEGRAIDEALAELFRIAREAGVRAHVSHIKLSAKPSWGRAGQILAAIDQARAEGLDVTQDEYLYTASSTGLSQLIPEEYREGDRFPKVLADPGQKAALVAAMKENLRRNGREDYAYAVIASYKHDPTLNGLNVAQAARKHRGAESLDDQIELILEIQQEGGAGGVFHGISEDDLRTFLAHPNTMFASDSGVRKFRDGVPHPRGYGNNARVLARYVRELKLLRLEEAVRRMTSLPAATFHLADRGVIRPGAWADLVVFDPAQVQEHASFDDPHHYATGLSWVLVNGIPVIQADTHLGTAPGRALPHGESQ